MSLFPAYPNQAKNNKGDTSDKSWLENSSFQVDLIGLNNKAKPSTSKDSVKTGSGNENSDRKHSRIKKLSEFKNKTHKKKSIPKNKDLTAIEKTDYFEISIKGCKEFLTVKTISRPSAPTYKVHYFLNAKTATLTKKFKRYFVQVLDSKINKNNSEKDITITKQNISTVGFNNKDENFTGFKQEEELSQKTAYYNRKLSDSPNDIGMWLSYSNFQDTIYQFEKTYRKGSIAKAQRVLAERKLAIIDKALSENPNCELLHRERLKIAVGAFPADELQSHLKDLVEKDKGNIILWQGYIEATQCSMSHCNTPTVMNLYTKCLSTLHKLRRATILEKYFLEENILRMLYQCGLFLKQAGLFEQLWVLLRMYLELNLSPNDNKKFDILSGCNEKQLYELEEVIFTSQLPLHELWLRTEKLRESSHWLPYSGDDECEDPQRIVFSEDVAELIQPITVPENIFKLAASVFNLLKIPLLPCRHTTMHKLGFDYVPWSLDSVESLLAAYLPLYPVDITNKDFLNTSQLAVGPQYLKVFPGKDEYLEFILKVMQNSSDSLSGDDKVSIMVWFFRFQRLLIILDKLDHMKLNKELLKFIRKNIKDILKIEENRQNEIYYLEYALIEYELGGTESCFTIINTALSMNKSRDILTESWDNAQANRCYLYRILIQLMLAENTKLGNSKALMYLCDLALQKKHENVTEDLINQVETKYNFVTVEILTSRINNISLSHHFHPDFFTDWIMCHGWLIYLSKGPDKFNNFIRGILNRLEDDNKKSWQTEILYEYYVAVLFKHYTDVPACGLVKLLDEVLHKAIEYYPNNLFLLKVLAKEQSLKCSLGPSWWKVQRLLIKSGRALAIVFTVIILNQHIAQIQEKLTDTITGENYNMDSNSKNRMLSLFKKITSTDISTRRCGLVWRLYLQFVYNCFPSEICRKVYYSAVEECPWLKALYIDAAIYIPAELPQIQDLIIEKQLRLHVTPEELDALRS